MRVMEPAPTTPVARLAAVAPTVPPPKAELIRPPWALPNPDITAEVATLVQLNLSCILDRESADRVLDLMREVNREEGATFLICTHDEGVAARCTRRLTLSDGLLISNHASALFG